MKTRSLGAGGFRVSEIGLGCMGMSFAYGGAPEEASLRTLHRALDLGVTFLDTAEVYGPYTNEILVGKAIRDRRSQVQVATKFGFRILPEGEGVSRMAGVDSRPEHVRRAVEASLARLGIDTIDLLYQHRVDPAVPIAEVVGAMSELVVQGKVRFLGLSEVSPATLRAAHAVHPITAVQSEYSLWSRDPENGILAACDALGVGFVPYSPLGRGYLTGALHTPAELAEGDFRRTLPRFQEAAMQANRALVDRLETIATGKCCSLAQLSLAWLLTRGPGVVPIPGARRIDHLEDNAAASGVSLSEADLALIGEALAAAQVTGARYGQSELAFVE